LAAIHRRRRTGWIPVLALLVALAPWFGAWHRVAHAAGLGVPTLTSQAAGDSAGFGHAAGSVDCALFDAALWADGPPPSVPPLALPPLAPCAPVLHAPEAPALALGWRAPARGPPQA
jgi:hypothetical protein